MFSSVFGISKEKFQNFLKQVGEFADGETMQFKTHLEEHLLDFLFYIKNYPTWRTFSFLWSKSVDSLFDGFHRMMHVVEKWSQKQLVFPNEEERSANSVRFMKQEKIVFCFDCCEQIVCSSIDKRIENIIFGSKYKDHTFNILVGCNPKNGKVMFSILLSIEEQTMNSQQSKQKTIFSCFINQTFEGKKNDVTALYQTELWKWFKQDEYICGDQAFGVLRDFHPSTLIKNKMPQDYGVTEEIFNNNVDSVRIIIENVFAYVRRFNICDDKLRIKKRLKSIDNLQKALNFHNRIWRCVCGILNAFGSIRKISE